MRQWVSGMVRVGALLAPLLCLSSSGCSRQDPGATREPDPLARIGTGVITQADFDFEVQRRASAGRPIGEAREILQFLVERQAMLQKAHRSEAMQDPQVRRELENRLLGQWLDLSLQAERDAVRASDEDLRAYYDAHADEFSRPAMARLAILFRRVNPQDAQESESSVREELEKARAAYLAAPAAATQGGRIPGFGTVAAESSEDTVSRYRGGDLGWMTTPESGGGHPESVMSAGFKLEPGAVSEVMTTDKGLYVVMKSDARPAQITPFEQAAPGLRRRLIRLKQEAVERAFMSNLLAEAGVSIDEDKAARLTVPKEVVPGPPVLIPAVDAVPGGAER